ncbi:hypothetical protein MASR1M74_04180 [Lentimicrobium sp.]
MLLKPDGLDFDGALNGSLNLRDAYHTRKLTTDLMVKDFAASPAYLGDNQILCGMMKKKESTWIST